MSIAFYLNRENRPRRVSPAPDLTVLQYLRGEGLRGSKEGCASGDCGACTAALASLAPDGASLAYTPVNTCICFMSALHGKLLVSVDGLAEDNGDLHPVQQAMADLHGSQCGFCTPGFVMSLFAMTKAAPPAATHDNVVSAIAGNLCRCTGYRPIIAAGKRLLAAPPASDYYDQNQKTIAERLRNIAALPACAAAGAENPAENRDAAAPAPDIVIASRAADIAARQHRAPNTALLAGGTDLALTATIQDQHLPPKIDISRAQDLRDIADAADHWRIGAAVTVGECMEHFAAPLPAFVPYLHRFGSAPIRARATVGGNIGNASPIADLPPPFIALGAQLILDSGDSRRQLPLEAFYLDYKKTALRPDEWISAVIVPKPAPDAVFKMFKISKRIEDDISAVAGAFYWRIDADNHVQEARLAFGGMAATPKRAAAAESRYAGAPWTAQTTVAAAAALPDDFTPLTDARASAAYRLQTAAALLHRAWHETQTPTPRIESYCHAD